MLPAEGRDMLQHIVRDNSSLLAEMTDGAAEVDRVPVDDCADHQVEAGGAECLAVKGTVTDFAAFVKEDGALEFVRGLALVEACLAAPAQGRARIPLDHEQRTLERPSSRSALASWLGFGEAASFLSMVGRADRQNGQNLKHDEDDRSRLFRKSLNLLQFKARG